jgi:hypothetical protein
MRVFLGMVLGAILTVVGAFSYDVLSGKTVNTDSTAMAANDERPMVNWDVVNKNWQNLETNLREMGQRVHEQWTKRFG